MTAHLHGLLPVGAFCVCAVALRTANAQRSPTSAPAPLSGCWRLEPGPFAVLDGLAADPGQTNLPSLVSFDTVSGHAWDDSPIGRQVRTVSDTAATRYRLGYYQFVPPDTVRVDWTNSVVGMTLELRVDGVAIRGSATAWTDYGDGQRANIVLRRAACARVR